MHREGDKVRVRSSGARGIIADVGTDLISVRIGDAVVRLALNEVTNYSAAARRAWAVRPKRSGRPRLETPRKRMVAMRLDIEVLDLIALLVEHGLVANREQAVNAWCREAAREMLATSRISEGNE